MPSFHNNGADVHYEVTGDGSPLLLIAGTASDSASWGPLVPLLAGRQLILIDNRGSGRTKVDGPLTHGDMSDDCAALIDHLGFGRVDVVGHSLGGYLGLRLAAQHAGKVRRLVTLTAGGMSPKTRALFEDLAKLYFIVPPEQWFRLLYQWLFSAPFFADDRTIAAAAAASTAYTHRQSPGDFARQIAASGRGAPADLSQVACPVLAVAAELDLLTPPAMVDAMHAPVRDLRTVLIKGAAHSIHWERPAEVALAISDFLNPETLQ